MIFYRRILVKWVHWICRRSFHRFMSDNENVYQTQSLLLKKILVATSKTSMGKNLYLTGIGDYEEFTNKIAISGYDDDLRVWVEKQRQFPTLALLSATGVSTFQKTSGSSGRFKLIPYNRALLKSFENYFKIWCCDILTNGPRFQSYRTFLSISPAVVDPLEEVDCGFSDDSDYLGFILKWLIQPFLVVPLHLKNIKDPHQFWLRLSSYLVNDPQLEIISVWHPSFLVVLLDFISKHRKEIASSIGSGVAGAPNQRNLLLLSRDQDLNWSEMWPNLKFISAWEAANSAHAARFVKSVFPSVLFQGKGLLATECPMTLPLIGKGSLAFLSEVFFEFLDPEGRVWRLHEVVDGHTYVVVVTQQGGFLRYNTGDQVRVTRESSSKPPVFEFLGRQSDIADLVGEKISSHNVDELVTEISSKWRLLGLCLLVVEPESSLPHYKILFDGDREISIEEMAQFVEHFLSEHFHYRYARQLGQLGPAQSQRVENLTNQLIQFYQNKKKIKAGDIKLKYLVANVAEANDLQKFVCDTMNDEPKY